MAAEWATAMPHLPNELLAVSRKTLRLSSKDDLGGRKRILRVASGRLAIPGLLVAHTHRHAAWTNGGF